MVQTCMVQKVNLICDSVRVLPELLADLGLKKPLFICDSGIVKSGLLAKTTAAFDERGMEYAVFEKVIADPPEYLAAEGIATYKENGCDSIIGVGGGSAIDTAKAVNILRYNEGPIMRYAAGEEMHPSPGLIVVPTTSGTGSEMSDGLVITSGQTKVPILADKAMCEYAVLDPEMTVGLPPALTAMTGYDALAHAAEAYTSTVANGLTDMVCEKILETVARWLPIAVKEGSSLEARRQMSMASSLGGWMLSQAHTNAGHSVAHVLGGSLHMPHGLCCAYALPETAAFNAPALPEKTAWIAACFGGEVPMGASPEEIGAAAKEALIRFRDDVLGLGPADGAGIDRSLFDAMAEAIEAEPFQNFNPRKMGAQDAKQILENIFPA